MKAFIYTTIASAVFGLFSIYASSDSPRSFYAEEMDMLIPNITDKGLIFEDQSCYSVSTSSNKEKIPHFVNAWQTTSDCPVDSKKVSEAMAIFYRMWVEEFGEDKDLNLFKALNNLKIKWAEIPLINYEWYKSGNVKTTELVFGEARDKETIWIVRNPKGNLYSNPKVLVHELVHIALWATTGSPDHDHEGSSTTGWTEKHTKFITSVSDYLKVLN